ncbi:MAG: 2-oxoglutarate dehydrogenase E1 component [Chloroflexia bacterium]|jgi:2-oxoglutarate dehydrogenase E1 component|nr:2-oxoglutarate dehydrogenase E1 component [Chloroflexia bacterium]MDQ3614174.1 2-oxoglutarate dehydrogenase E1 component [Chloroflexota bacterium]
MSDLRTFIGPNAGYVLELYDRYLADPESVDADSRAFLEAFTPSQPETAVATTLSSGTTATSTANIDLKKVAGAIGLATGIREYGHLAVPLDPLGSPPPGAPELDLETYGITQDDLRSMPAEIVGGEAADGAANAAEAIDRLRTRYTARIGFDFDHVQVAEERAWLNDAVESGRFEPELDDASRRKVLERLTQVEVFERYLHQTYLGQKRFSIEGNDILVPMLDQITDDASAVGTREVFLGMAHRGRLSVMTHILSKPYGAIIAAFEGGKRRTSSGSEAADDVRTGDVKYHLGARLARNPETGERVKMQIVLAPNPSHLEAVNPIVLGMARAAQDDRTEPGTAKHDPTRTLAVLLHGDAAFPGQGVVAESLNLSGLKGYSVGGTIHIIVNNQIGYTTDAMDSRSTYYAGDLAKGFEIPVVHVNADDALACLHAAQMAMAYRREFKKDFLIDLVGYRRWGHNEGDEPAFTQPLQYQKITKHSTARAIYAEQLVGAGVVTKDDASAMEQRVQDRLSRIRKGITEGTESYDDHEELKTTGREEVDTSVTRELLDALDAGIHAMPEGFSANTKLKRQWDRRATLVSASDGKIDWSHAESLAFAAILANGTPIRMTGQDTQRGTFSQRHLVLHDSKTGEAHSPLHYLPEARASFSIYNSPLSENACMGFEYGYSVQAPEALVLWEAQFGDFVNGGQIVIDQFLSAARAKWGQEPSLVLLLPHGYEGQGPEHSSARLERFLQLAAVDNMRVANLTSAAQYFHLLRRQAARLDRDPRPLVLMTPKSLLRHPMAASSPEQFLEGTFRPVIDDPRAEDRKDKVTRVVLCSGKVAIDLDGSDARDDASHVAVVRVEQLAPFQGAIIKQILDTYPNLQEVVWLQEEPKNMGGWSFMVRHLRDLLADSHPVRYIGRPERSSPAEGSLVQHNHEQGQIVAAAFDGGVARESRAGANGAKARVAKSDRVGADPVSARRKQPAAASSAE